MGSHTSARRKILDTIDDYEDHDVADGVPVGDVFEEATETYGIHDTAEAFAQLIKDGEVYQPATRTVRRT